MRVVDAIAEVLKREGVEFLSAYPTTVLIEAAAAAGIRPVLCRQERVGVGIADGFSRVSNGRRLGVFAMQYGPGAENAFPGVTTAYSDSTPILVLPLGHRRDRAQVFPLFSSARTYASVTKSVEQLTLSSQVADVMRRAFSLLRTGRGGPVMVELPEDVATEQVGESVEYRAVRSARAAGDPRAVEDAARAMIDARRPMILAGQGVLYAEATDELIELAELLQAPVMTTLEGKGAFPEDHRLALGTGGSVVTGPVLHALRQADALLAVGASLTKHGMSTNIPPGKTIVHATDDPRDINKSYPADHPIVGDAKLVLAQFVDAVKDAIGERRRRGESTVAAEVGRVRDEWLGAWRPKLTSDEVPINPYRVIWEFMQAVDPAEAIVTHDSGSPRDQIIPFYRATRPRGYLGWGKSHALGTGLGLAIGAKLARPDKLCVNFMGDAAFGMTGLDFETAVRCRIPILTIVLNNSTMAVETDHLAISHALYQTRDIGGSYADLARALGGWAERVDRPGDVADAIRRARRATEDGRAALLEFITSEEQAFSHRRAL
jgi:acetolactate synthase-1/2/3 large subunit